MSRRTSADALNSCADDMIQKIVSIVKEEIASTSPRIESAIVKNVNSDGTVDVYLPGDLNSVFTRIQNQSIYQDLIPGDSVEILLKKGKFSNCWIIAKHK